jgi:hypothetical protein
MAHAMIMAALLIKGRIKLMPKRENIVIKTKYKTKSECIEKCRDFKGKTKLVISLSRQISGEVFPDGRFELSSRAKGSAMYEFKGMIKEEEGCVYMVGEIIPKLFTLRIIYLSIVLGIIMAMVFIITMGTVGILFALLFATVPWLNLIAISRGDYLYKEIIRKVS